MEAYQFYNLTGGQTAEAKTVCNQPCVLGGVTVNKTIAATLSILDNTETVATLKASIVEGDYFQKPIAIKKKLIVTNGETGGNYTIAYKPA